MARLILILAPVIGAHLGSFLNVVVLRGISGGIFLSRSKCPKCSHTLSYLELVPIASFLALRGKCRHCGKQVSIKYLLVEAFVAILFLLEALWLQDVYGDVNIAFIAAQIVLFVVLIYLVVHDIWHMEIPLWPALGAVIPAVAMLGTNLAEGSRSDFLWWIISLVLPVLIIYGVSRLYTRQVFGMGDYLIILIIALALDAREVFIALELSIISAVIIGLIVVFIGKSRMNQTKIPLVPFLALGFLLSLNYAEQIWSALF